ncbi:beta-phosphoglucomutase [Thalassobacillus sp. CUG 92003]|uniref:beta-phosphoglucomutase n=1 Tax=Thalassobacillus sp. CUG 92003 TaxID=2736641 RepID=UPI0015E62D2C|nr:beta-phosphoglucomutase [Thalassobacillus sp. CUG 92003]
MKQLQAVIFDLDGVITDTAEFHYLAWKQLAEELNIPFDRAFNENLKGIGRLESLELILEHGGIQLSEQEKQRQASIKNDHYKEMIKKITRDDVLPGVRPFMEEVKHAGLKTGLASASKNVAPVIRQLEVQDLLDTVVNAAEVNQGKPHPEIFLTAAKQLEIQPEHCVGIEDAQAGVQAIKAANMFAIGVGDSQALKEADWVVDSPEQLNMSEVKKRFT